MSVVEDTGERVIPEFMKPSNRLLLEHMARYQFVLPYLKGRVLDFSCGSGYGTHMMVKEKKDTIEEVVGIDIDPEIIKYARGAYHHPKSSFIVNDVTDQKLIDKIGSFDTIVSFETLEHIKEEELLLQNYYNLLNPGGILIVSTPFGKGRNIECGQPFHVHQLTPDEFRGLFSNYSNVSYYYQNGVLIEPPREGVYHPLGIAICVK